MKTILLIGASGKISTLLLPQLLEAGYRVKALARKPSSFSHLSHPQLEWLQADLEEDFSFAYSSCDTVIFCAGSGASTGFDKTLLIDLWAAKHAVDYAKSSAISQFIMVSSRGAYEPDKGPERIKPYLVAKYFADRYLELSGLSFTILEPGRLLDEEPIGGYSSERPADSEAQVISRADVAAAILACLDSANCIGKRFELFKGKQGIQNILSGL